ncbi:putative ABC transport system permease protein [Lachnotalea glycerini]|uniref:Putative ABC transport system permease protein n=1 Tax=Lachnotalea glycerini TaxID=1763509 RepID=A0A318ET06_9FIRM|nr:ABC transporter permease [Lachnotalea glycerini]PXV95650.1 putative ABC transport system permease protein [Lachnotalea glycerini]
MMLIMENILLAVNSLLANKMRALLTMLGIIIGIGSVIAIMTVGNSLTNSVSSSMESMGVNNITVGLQQKSEEKEVNESGAVFGNTNYSSAAATDKDYLTTQMIEKLCETYPDSIEAISASITVGSGQSKSGNTSANTQVIGTSAGYFVASNLTFLKGGTFSERDYDGAKKVAIVSDKFVNNMFDGDNEKALGSEVEVKTNDKYIGYTIVGVYKYEESSLGFSSASDDTVTTNMYIPLKTAISLDHSTGFSQFSVVTKTGIDSTNFVSQIERFFEPYYRNNNDFEVSAFSMESIVSTMMDMLSTITVAISVIAGIALLVGGIGVMNIMLVSITERTREIGTRKALGATNGSIRLQFIVEAVIICLIGGILGIILGVILGNVAATILGYPASASVTSILISLVFAMTIGVFFGYYPANKAAKMNPIEALRYE